MAFEPHYPAKSPLDDVLRLAAPGGDEFTFERYAVEIAALLGEWGRALRVQPPATAVLNRFVDRAIQSTSFIPIRESRLRSGGVIEVVRREFGTDMRPGGERLIEDIRAYLRSAAAAGDCRLRNLPLLTSPRFAADTRSQNSL